MPMIWPWDQWNKKQIELAYCWTVIRTFFYIITLKFIPWKQASEMLVPCSSIVPPNSIPDLGSGTFNVDIIRPIAFRDRSNKMRWLFCHRENWKVIFSTFFNGFCQCLWCWASLQSLASNELSVFCVVFRCLRDILFDDRLESRGSAFVNTRFDDLNCWLKNSSSL